LVLPNRILYARGVVNGFGHVSTRQPDQTDTFPLLRSCAPALIKEADISCYGLDGEALRSTAGKPYLERFIHSEIYRDRPDVITVVHSHTPSVIPFGITGHGLRPVFHISGFPGAVVWHILILATRPVTAIC
jgi:ribulose-5-phosphate 4-epimerase/fuculose-1-phosphate aldolase